jgi:hypothetical protein
LIREVPVSNFVKKRIFFHFLTLYIVDVWHSQKGSFVTNAAGSLEKEDVMWIVYLVVAVVGLVFGVLSLTSLELEA